MKHLDMTGQVCPIPVVQARRALRSGEGAVSVTVDNMVAAENLKKMADGDGYAYACEALDGGHFYVTLGAAQTGDITEKPAEQPNGSALFITRAALGDGDAALGAMLMKGFIFAQTELTNPPADIIFANGGALLTTEGAATVPDLRALEERGARVWTCGTCANFYGITDALAVGKITDMLSIAKLLAAADKVVTL